MIFKDYYKILGLETNKVSNKEIKIAYKEQAKKYHPDLNGGSKQFEERFKDINEAYKVLSNFASKRKYDRTWTSHIGKKRRNSAYQAQSGREILWKVFFGNTFQKRKENETDTIRGENIETEIEISLEEAFYGKEKQIALRTVNGKMATFKVSIPAGIQNNERIRLIRARQKG